MGNEINKLTLEDVDHKLSRLAKGIEVVEAYLKDQIPRLIDRLVFVEQRLEKVELRFDKVEKRLVGLDRKLDVFNDDLLQVKDRVHTRRTVRTEALKITELSFRLDCFLSPYRFPF